MIHIKVGVIDCEIEGPYPRYELDKALSYYMPGFRYAPAYKSHQWDGKTHLLGHNKFPSGLLSKVVKILKEAGHNVLVDRMPRTPLKLEDHIIPGVELREYQKEAVYAMLQKKRGIIKVPTAGGKTLIAASAIRAFNVPTAYVVHTGELARQTIEVFQKVFPFPIGIVGQGKQEWKFITVCMVQSLTKLIAKKQTKPLLDFQSLIVDECHHVASGKTVGWYVAARHFKNAWLRFGMSATPILKKRGLLLEGTTGPVIADVKMTELQEKGFIAHSMIEFHEYQAPIVHGRSWSTVYDRGIVNCTQRNRLGCKLATECAKGGKLVMMFVEHIVHGILLRNTLQSLGYVYDLRVEFLSGEDDREFIKEVKQSAKEKKVNILIVTRKLFGEGIDIPTVDTLINLAGGQSPIAFIQMFGRGLRISRDKEHLHYVDFVDTNHEWLMDHANARMNHCKRLGQEIEIKGEEG